MSSVAYGGRLVWVFAYLELVSLRCLSSYTPQDDGFGYLLSVALLNFVVGDHEPNVSTKSRHGRDMYVGLGTNASSFSKATRYDHVQSVITASPETLGHLRVHKT